MPAKARVITMPVKAETAWSALGFETERDMLVDDLRNLDRRLKSSDTTATAVAALSKRKQEVFEQIKLLDSGGDDDDVIDDSGDEEWNATGE